MNRLYILFLLFASLLSCSHEESALADDISSKTESKQVELLYTYQTLPRPKRTIDCEIEQSAKVKKEADAEFIASRTALVILEKIDKQKLEENESIRIKFINPDFPKSSLIDSENFYSFDITELKKVSSFIYLSENIIRGYYLGNYVLANARIDSSEIIKIDTLLGSILPKNVPMTNFTFLKFASLNDSLGNKYTGILNSITTNKGEKLVTIIFNNSTREIIEIN